MSDGKKAWLEMPCEMSCSVGDCVAFIFSLMSRQILDSWHFWSSPLLLVIPWLSAYIHHITDKYQLMFSPQFYYTHSIHWSTTTIITFILLQYNVLLGHTNHLNMIKCSPHLIAVMLTDGSSLSQHLWECKMQSRPQTLNIPGEMSICGIGRNKDWSTETPPGNPPDPKRNPHPGVTPYSRPVSVLWWAVFFCLFCF